MTAGWLLDAVRAHAPELEPILRLEWTNHTGRYGDAALCDPSRWPRTANYQRSIVRLAPVARVRLSTWWWPRRSPEENRNTVLHEVAHLVHAARGNGLSDHGAEWRGIAAEIGVRCCDGSRSVKVPWSNENVDALRAELDRILGRV